MKPSGTAARGWLVTLGAALAMAALLVGIAVHASAASAGPGAVVTWIKTSNSLNGSVEIAKLNGSGVRTLGPGTSATVAPDGAAVAVVESLPPAGNATSELLAYPANGGAAALKLYHCDGFLRIDGWSADSKLILASCPHGLNDKGPLLVIAAGGGSVATIASGVIDGASFAPNRSDDVVYALGSSQLLTAPVNLFTTSSTGTRTQQLDAPLGHLRPGLGTQRHRVRSHHLARKGDRPDQPALVDRPERGPHSGS